MVAAYAKEGWLHDVTTAVNKRCLWKPGLVKAQVLRGTSRVGA